MYADDEEKRKKFVDYFKFDIQVSTESDGDKMQILQNNKNNNMENQTDADLFDDIVTKLKDALWWLEMYIDLNRFIHRLIHVANVW